MILGSKVLSVLRIVFEKVMSSLHLCGTIVHMGTRSVFFNGVVVGRSLYVIFFESLVREFFSFSLNFLDYIFTSHTLAIVTKPTWATSRAPKLTHNSPKYLEWNLALEEFEGFFPLNCAILSFQKCLNYQISGFQRGDIFFIVTIMN